MYRGNFPGSGFPAQFPPNVGPGGPRPRLNYPPERNAPQRQQERAPPSVEEEMVTRPIIKEEDLSRMDDISRDAGWAAQDDIDYNQKLAFSDDELENDQPSKKEDKELKEEKSDENPPEERDTRERDAKEPRGASSDSQQPLRSWNQSQMSRDFRGLAGPPPSASYPPQQPPLRPAHSIRCKNHKFFLVLLFFKF